MSRTGPVRATRARTNFQSIGVPQFGTFRLPILRTSEVANCRTLQPQPDISRTGSKFRIAGVSEFGSRAVPNSGKREVSNSVSRELPSGAAA